MASLTGVTHPSYRPPVRHLVISGLVVVPFVLSGCAAGGGNPASAESVPDGAQQAEVVRVVDGDTLLLAGRGDGPLGADETRVRLLEIDAPESVTPDRPVECFGPETADALRALAPVGSTVFVTADREPEDRFGRALLYVWTTDGLFVNEELVRTGHAEAVLVGDNDAHIDELRAAQDAARDAGTGMWGACP